MVAKISVICPTFNAGAFVAQTLQSVIDQVDPSFEIIVADGGSSDDTLAIVASFRPHVTHVIEGPDRGQRHAIDRAVTAASGEIIYWLNADDIVMPGAFREARRLLQDDSIDFVYSDDFAFDAEARSLSVGPTIRGLKRRHHELFYRQLYSETVFFKSYLVPEPQEGEYDLRVYTDYAFFLRTLSGAKGKWTSKRMGAFRIVAGQASQRHAERKLIEFKRVRAAYYSIMGWEPRHILGLKLLHFPSFALTQWLWPALERGSRRLWRWASGDKRRRDQANLFFDEWLLQGQPNGEPQDTPRDRHQLETGLYR